MAKNSEDPKEILVALHKDGLGYKKIAKTLKLSMVAKTIQRFNRTGSTQNRPRHGRSKRLSARAQHHIQRLSLGDRQIRVLPALLLVSAQTIRCIELVCMAVVPEGSLF